MVFTRWRLLPLPAKVESMYADGCCRGPVFQPTQLVEGRDITVWLAPSSLQGAASFKAWTRRSRGLVSTASRVSRRKQA